MCGYAISFGRFSTVQRCGLISKPAIAQYGDLYEIISHDVGICALRKLSLYLRVSNVIYFDNVINTLIHND